MGSFAISLQMLRNFHQTLIIAARDSSFIYRTKTMSLSKFATPTRNDGAEESDAEDLFGGLLPKRRNKAGGYRRTHSMAGEPAGELDTTARASICKRLNFDDADAALSASTIIVNTPQSGPVASPQPVKVTKFDLTVFRRAKLTYAHGSGQVRFAHDFDLDGTGKQASFTITLLQLKGMLRLLPLFQANLERMDATNAADVNLLESIGGKVHLRLSSPYTCVNIRTFERGSKGVLYPSKMGVALRKAEIAKLETHVDALMQLLVAQNVNDCFHGNYEAEQACAHCTPYPATPADDTESDDY